jgi:hypothetical protein
MNLKIELQNSDNDLYLINNELYIKVYLVNDDKTETDITNSNKLICFSLNNDIVYVYDKVIDNPFRLFFKSKGFTNVYFVYEDDGEKLTIIKPFRVLKNKLDNTYKPKKRIEIRRQNEESYGINNAHTLNSTINFYVVLIDEEDLETDVTHSEFLSFYSLDDDNLFLFDKMENQPFSVLFRKEGTGFLKAIYNDSTSSLLIDTRNFICYVSFFKDSYLNHLMGDFNKEKILSNPKNRAVFDTFMEMLDILYAYNQDLKEIGSFDNTKSNFLDILAQNVGFLRVDTLARNTALEDKEDYIFRELLKSMVDLLSIRGTKAAYELFFSAIGYNIRLNEFWYDENGDLVEIDPYDEQSTTYIGYNTDGSLKNNVAKKQNDPRRNIQKQQRFVFNVDVDNENNIIRSYEMPFDMPIIENVFVYLNCIKCGPKRDYKIINKNRIVFNMDLNLNDGDVVFVLKNPDYSVFRNAKSNYMRVNISSKDGDKFTPPSFFSTQKKKIINYYLDFLKPIHMQYLPEFLINDIVGDENGIGEILDIASFADANDVKVGKFKGYLNNQVIGRVPAIPISDVAFDNIFSMGNDSDKIGTDINTYINRFEIFDIIKNTLDENSRNVNNGIFDSYGKKCLRWDIDGISFDKNYSWDEKSFLLDSLTITKR